MYKMDNIKEQIHDLLLEELQIRVDNDQVDMIEMGLIDSIGFLTLFVGLEERFGIKVLDEDLHSPLLSSVSGIEKFVKQKKQAL